MPGALRHLTTRLLCCLPVVLLAVLLVNGSGFASTTGGGIGLAPAHVDPGNPASRAYFIRTVPADGSFSDQVIVSNSTNAPVELYVNAVDGLTSPASGAVYANRGDAVLKTGAWVKPDVSTVTVPAQGRTPVGFTLHVPRGASAGDHLAGIAFENVKPTSIGAGALSVTTVLRSVIGILVQVPGPAAFHLRIDGVQIEARPGFGTASLVVTLGDDGLLLGKPLLEVRVKGDHYDRAVSRQLDTLLPGDVIPFALPWPDPLDAGTYQVTVTGSGAGLASPIGFVTTVHLNTKLKGTQPVPTAPNSSMPFTPWLLLLALVVAVGIGIGLGWLFPQLRRRVHRPDSTRAKPGKEAVNAKPSATEVAISAMLSGPVTTAPLSEQVLLTSIEVEISPQRFRFFVVPGRGFTLGEDGEVLADVRLRPEQETRLLEAVRSLVVVNRLSEVDSADAEIAFTPDALRKESIHLRFGLPSGRRWSAWYPAASAPPNLWRFAQALLELGDQALNEQTAELLAKH